MVIFEHFWVFLRSEGVLGAPWSPYPNLGIKNVKKRAQTGTQFGALLGAIGSFLGVFLRFEKWLIFDAVLKHLLAALGRLHGNEVL